MNGRPLAIPWEAENIPAIVESWFLGTEHGAAVADVLFGNSNPSGKLAVTFPRNVGQVPIYYAHMNTGRPATSSSWTSKYLDCPNTPQFPFGFGLSYTLYGYSSLALDRKTLGPGGEIKVTARVRNSGKIAGTEIVQLYIRDRVASITQPVKKLVDFQRVVLAPGQTKTVKFILRASQLGFYDGTGKYLVEPGPFDLWVAKDSSDETLKAGFEMTR
jgi:beta-glucosidase